MEVIKNKWFELLAEVQKVVDKDVFETWFKPIKVQKWDEGGLKIGVPNNFFKKWFVKNYLSFLNEFLKKNEVKINEESIIVLETPDEIITQSSETNSDNNIENISKHNIFFREETYLNPKYSFENFVVGKCNEFVYASCLAVGNEPGKRFNPLYIYGGVCYGKTHLLHATGHYVKKNSRSMHIRYLSAETFMNEYILSVKQKKMDEFKYRFRNFYDLILVDDIQFFSGDTKSSTQEEFFHTFNALVDSNKQIVLSCDKQPKELEHLQERLRSRFEMGLVVNIKPPDMETKVAILKKKATDFNKDITLPDDVAFFLASKIYSNIRDLEGALVRTLAYSSFTGASLNLETAKEALKDFLPDKKTQVSPDIIINEVARFYNLRVQDIKSKSRNKRVIVPRQVSMYLMKYLIMMSLSDIGEYFGGKDHTTVLHSIRKIECEIESGKVVKDVVETIKKKFQ